jgi:hypothetical protein
MSDIDLVLCASLVQLLPELLRDHPYGIYELAQECANRLNEPLCETMTSLGEALQELTQRGEIAYDRTENVLILP